MVAISAYLKHLGGDSKVFDYYWKDEIISMEGFDTSKIEMVKKLMNEAIDDKK